MKLLITGKPRSGKTTLLRGIIESIPEAFWVIAEEIRNPEGERVGFSAENSAGANGVLSHKIDIESSMVVGDYKVDIDSLDYIFSEPLVEAAKANKFLIIDEIGRMQMLSKRFAEVTRQVFDSKTDVIASIAYDAEWTAEFTDRSDIMTLVITQENRAEAKATLESIIKARFNLKGLEAEQQDRILGMAHQYAKKSMFTQLRKLFKNSITYLKEKRITPEGISTYRVHGNTSDHTVFFSNEKWNCDCVLFNGRAQFLGRAGECSHIQSAKIFSLSR